MVRSTTGRVWTRTYFG
ncbi:hypothetical protein LINPERPRIM_LOCUS18645 [Linum perenne]